MLVGKADLRASASDELAAMTDNSTLVWLVLFLLFLLVALISAIWASWTVLFTRKLSRRLRVTYIVGAIGLLFVTYWMTYHYRYLADSNTQIFGWPIPIGVFQREGPTSPWLDFVGPTVFLAYPINLLILLFVPSVLVIFGVLAFKMRTATLSKS